MATPYQGIPEHFVRTFETNWNHAVQQMLSKLKECVTPKQFEGKEHVMTDLKGVSFNERITRLGNTDPDEVEAGKRKLSKRDFKCAVIFDRKDKDFLGQLQAPQSEIMDEMRFAWQRKLDELIIEAASATAYGGPDPYVTAITLPSGQKVAVDYVHTGSAANSGMTPWKINEATRIFETNEIYANEEELFLALSPNEKQDLIVYVQNSPNDVYAKMIAGWLNGETDKLMGFRVKETNRLIKNTSTDIRTCIAWSKRGIFVAPDTFEIRIDELPTQDHALQLVAYAEYGAVRRYEERVVEIYSDDSP